MHISEFQQLMRDTYAEQDNARGVPATLAWLLEELGELQAVRKGSPAQRHTKLATWASLASLANQIDVDLEAAARSEAAHAASSCICG